MSAPALQPGRHRVSFQRIPRGRPRSAQRGMTLLEVLLSIAILVTGMVAIFALLSSGLASHRRAVAETEASMVASSTISELRSEFARGSLPRSDAKDVFHDSPDFPDYRINKLIIPLDQPRRSSADLSGDREYFVRVTVRWTQKGENKSVVVNTVIFSNRKTDIVRSKMK
jgi:prepilin-type N-terminal cleavage/methylation domain-containing protein